mgnify:CR=1 FL=1
MVTVGKTPKPLYILVVGLDRWEELDALTAQGHIIDHDSMPLTIPLGQHDLTLGPTCWLMDDAHRKYLDLAIASARKRRYPKEAKGE